MGPEFIRQASGQATRHQSQRHIAGERVPLRQEEAETGLSPPHLTAPRHSWLLRSGPPMAGVFEMCSRAAGAETRMCGVPWKAPPGNGFGLPLPVCGQRCASEAIREPGQSSRGLRQPLGGAGPSCVCACITDTAHKGVPVTTLWLVLVPC